MKSKLFKVLPVVAALLVFSAPAFAQDGGADSGKGLIGLGAGLIMGLGILGAGMGQGKIGSSALEGMARNPQAGGDIRGAMILSMVFPESLVILGFVIAILLQGKL